jgi:hypothetical protein
MLPLVLRFAATRFANDRAGLARHLKGPVVRPAEAKFNELLARRANKLRVENI